MMGTELKKIKMSVSIPEHEDECLQAFKNRIESELERNQLLFHVKNEEEILKVFLIGRKYQVDWAFQTLEGYLYNRYVKYEHIFQIKLNSVRYIIESGIMNILKSLDSLGRIVFVGNSEKLDLVTMSFEPLFKAVSGMIECLWVDSNTCRNGQVVIVDFKVYGIYHSRSYTFSQKLQAVNILTRNYPMQVKELIALNAPRFAGIMLTMVKPFLPRKIKRRISLYGSSFAALHEKVSPEILPKWLGGKLTDEEAFDTEFIQRALDKENYEE